jgi:hypothetical protein
MFNYAQLQWKLHKLARVWDHVDAANEARLKEARDSKALAEVIAEINREIAADYFEHEDDVRRAHTKYLLAEASRLIVPIPDREEENTWRMTFSGHQVLTETGINTLRAAVRAERKARLEIFLMWVPGVVGLLGAAIGLASILIKK